MDIVEFDESILQEFVTESREHLEHIEDDFLRLEKEKDNPDPELINKVFRSIHTIKGGAGFLGLVSINELSHSMETVLSMVRSGQLPLSSPLIDSLLGGADCLKLMISDVHASEGVDIQGVRDRLTGLLNSSLPGEVKKELDTRVPLLDGKGRETNLEIDRFSARSLSDRHAYLYALTVDFGRLLKESREEAAALMKELLDNGEILDGKLDTPMDDLHAGLPSGPLHHLLLYSTSLEPKKIKKIPGIVKSQRLKIKEPAVAPDQPLHITEQTFTMLDEEGEPLGETSYQKLGDILIEWGDMTREDVDKVLEMQKVNRFGQLAVQAGLVSSEKLKAALVEQERQRQEGQKRESGEQVSSIRVPAVKIDALVNLVGELVTFQARLAQVAARKNDPELRTLAKGGERLIAALRDNSMGIRMLPISVTFGKFSRMVRDLAKELGKEIELSTSGGETELDKTVIERLNDPLVHLIRNSVDHGIEIPAQRQAVGKPRQGILHLSAEHSGASVLIRIRDDGAGLDSEAIRARAVERGLINADTEYSEKELFNLIFMPGFSTAKKVTSVSGRGVGMDVVRKNIDSLRGSIDIDSKRHEGTTITLKLPLTLAIIDGLLVKIASDFFVLPLSVVERCVELQRGGRDADRRRVTVVQGELLPYIILREQFSISGTPPEIEQIVITEVGNRRVGLVVDRVIGEYQTVIKPLGNAYRDVERFSGATIMGDGTVALILDVNRLVKLTEAEEQARCGAGRNHEIPGKSGV